MVSAADADELLRNADAAMYMAKENGKDNYQLFKPEIHARAMARMELKAELQRALDAGEFTLRYQPIMDLERGDMAGMEALARWEHPERGRARADRVRAAARGNGADRAGRPPRSSARPARGRRACSSECPRDPPLSMAVNVSARQLQRAEFIDEVARGAASDAGSRPRASRWS